MNRGSTPCICAARRKSDSADATIKFASPEALDAASHSQALLAIKGFPDRDRVTVGELAERLQIRHHSAVGLIDRLVAEKYVARDQSAEDRRQVHIRLMTRGEGVLEKLSTSHSEQLRRIGPGLSSLLRGLGKGDPTGE